MYPSRKKEILSPVPETTSSGAHVVEVTTGPGQWGPAMMVRRGGIRGVGRGRLCVSVGVDGEEEGCKKEGEGGSMCVVEGEEDSEEEDFTVKMIENQPGKFNTQIKAFTQ